MCSARLVELHPGGPVVAEVTIGDLVTDAGHCFWVIPPDALFTPRGRPPTAAEMAEARTPYNAPTAPPINRERVEPDDDQLAESEAIRLARIEQQRTPVDLLRAVA